VAMPGGASERCRRIAADPDRRMRLLQRKGFGAYVVVAVEPAREAGGRLRPELLEDREPFVGDGAAPVEIGRVERLEFLLEPAGADAQRYPSARQHVE